MKSRIKILLSDTLVFGIGNISSKMILFCLMPLYTTELTSFEYGVVDILNNFIELMIPIFTICISESVFRFCINSDENTRKDILFIALRIILFGCIIFSGLVYIYNYIYNLNYYIYIILIFATTSLKQLGGFFLRGVKKNKVFAISGILNAIFLLGFNLIFLKSLHMKSEGFMLSIVCANIVTFIFIFIFIFILGNKFSYLKKNSINIRLKKEMYKFSIPLVPNKLSWWLNTALNRYLIFFMIGPSFTGLFSAASKIPAIINLMSMVFQQAWMFSVTKEYESNNEKKFFSEVFNYYSSFILISCSILLTILPIISKIILKGEFYVAWRYIPMLLLSSVFSCYSIYFGAFYIATKKNKKLTTTTFVGTIINIGFCLILIPFFNVYGVLLASNFCYFLIVILRYIDSHNFFRLKINFIKLFNSLIILIFQIIFSTFTNIYYYKISILCIFLLLLINRDNIIILIKILYKKLNKISC